MLSGTSAKNSLGSSKKIEKKPKLPIPNMKRKFALIEQVSKKSQQTNQSTIIIHQSKISPFIYIYIYIHLAHPLLFCSQGFGHTRSERCGWSTRRLVHRGASQLRCSWNPSWVATVLSLISTPCRYRKILFVLGGIHLILFWILCGIHLHIVYLWSMYKNMYVCMCNYNITLSWTVYHYNDHHHHHHPHVFIITPSPSP